MQRASIRDEYAPEENTQRGYSEVVSCVNDVRDQVWAGKGKVLSALAVADIMSTMHKM